METDPLLGRAIGGGRYEIVSKLGQGGMGKVYAAWQKEVGRQVVVKLIHAHLVTDADIVQRLRQEMQLTAKVEHPNTIRLYDVGEEGGQPFLVMEFLQGQTLGAMLHAGGPMSPARIATIGVQIARGLRAIHAAGVVHRDLKPDNVMIVSAEGEADQAKILDFGIARPLAAAASKLTLAGRLVGTPMYMSPEQASGKMVDPRSDLYTLGVVLYEMAAGAPPFMGETALLLHAHVTSPPSPVTFGAGDSPELGALIMRLLSKAPEDRPANAAEVVHALERFLSTASTSPVSGLTGTFVKLESRPALAPAPPAPILLDKVVEPPPVGVVPASPGGKPRRRLLVPILATGAVLVALGVGVALGFRPPRGGTAVDAAAENSRGNALQRQGNLDEAERAYRSALLLTPGYVPSRFNLGLLSLRRGDATAALVTFDAIASEQPDHAGVLLARAEAHRQLGRRDEARSDLEEHVRRHPKDADGWLHLGRIRLSMSAGDAREAFCRARDLGSAEGAKGCPAIE